MLRLERGYLVYIIRQFKRGKTQKKIWRQGSPAAPRRKCLARGLCGLVRFRPQLHEPHRARYVQPLSRWDRTPRNSIQYHG